MSTAKRVLVIGANRGVGFELATRFLGKGYTVYGTYRSETAEDVSVQKLKDTGVKTFELDYAQEDSINAAAEQFGDAALDVLINNAGLCYLWDDKPFIEQSAEDLLTLFQVNTVGPFVASKAFLPALEKAEKGKIITMSSNMASVTDNETGGNLCYRLSKSAVNQLTKTMAIDLVKAGSKIMTLAVHPGYVATKMNDYYGEDDMEECMSSLVDTIEAFGTAGGASIPNGGYVNWKGKVMTA